MGELVIGELVTGGELEHLQGILTSGWQRVVLLAASCSLLRKVFNDVRDGIYREY